MPGKHAPASPKSFYLSLARAGAILAVVLGVTAGIAIVATGGGKKPAVHPSATPSVTASPSNSTPVAVPPVQVAVLNGTTRQGLASVVAARLTAGGWTVKGVPGNGPTTSKTTIYVRADAGADAERLRRTQFPFMSAESIVVATSADPGAKENAALTVVIGSDYPKVGSGSKSPTP